jgi:hypothetical protein
VCSQLHHIRYISYQYVKESPKNKKPPKSLYMDLGGSIRYILVLPSKHIHRTKS